MVERPLPKGKEFYGRLRLSQWTPMFGKTSLLPGKLLLCTHTYLDNADKWIWTSIFKWSFLPHFSTEHSLSPRPKFELAGVIWFPGHIPKMSCCTLRAIHDRLPTTARLKQFHIVQTDTCVLCNKETETISHLYFSCSYASYVWTLCKLKMGMNTPARTLEDEATYIKLKFKKKNKCYLLSRWHCAEQYGTYGMRGIEEYSNIRACVRYNYFEECMKTSISY